MANWLRFPLTLAVIAALAGGGLGFVEVATKQKVEENKKRKLSAAFKQVPGYADSREMEKTDDLEARYTENEKCFEILDASGELIGYAAQVTCIEPRCYNSGDPIVLVVVVSPELDRILLVRTTNNKETPGLGTRTSAEEPRNTVVGKIQRVPDRKGPDIYPFLDQFKDRPVDLLEINQDGLDSISGATVSSKAVAGGARKAVAFLKEVTGR